MVYSNFASASPHVAANIKGKTVLIVDDDPLILDVYGERCRQLGLNVETAPDGLRGVLKVGKLRPDLLILDLGLPDVEGFRVVERLSDPKFAPVPVIILSGRSDDAAIQRAQDLNVYYVHKSPTAWADLQPLLVELLNQASAAKEPAEPEAPDPHAMPRVLLVDRDPERLSALARTMAKYQLEILEAGNAMEGFLTAVKEKPDAVIAEYDMEEGNGNYLMTRLKTTSATRQIPLIVFAGQPIERGYEFAIQRALLGKGQAAAFLSREVNAATLAEEAKTQIERCSRR